MPPTHRRRRAASPTGTACGWKAARHRWVGPSAEPANRRPQWPRLHACTPEHPTYQTLVKKIGQLEAQKNKLMGKIDALPMTQQELLRLNRDMQVTTRTYTLLLDKAQEQDILRAGTIGNVRIIDSAYAVVE